MRLNNLKNVLILGLGSLLVGGISATQARPLSSTHVTSQAVGQGCEGHLRFVHGHPFEDGLVYLSVGNQRLTDDLSFSSFTDYLKIRPGKHSLKIHRTFDDTILESKDIEIGPNVAITVVYAGPAKGPEGMQFGNESPFIMLDDISPVNNPARWKGHWYRMSETDVVIDFEVTGQERGIVSRLFSKPNRSTYQLGDFPAGSYRFNPVLEGSRAPLFNDALEPSRNVELSDVVIEPGTNFDVLALGNFLGKGPNSLRLVGHKYKTEYLNGCFDVSTLSRYNN